MHHYFYRAVKQLNGINTRKYVYSGTYIVLAAKTPTEALEGLAQMLLNREPQGLEPDITNFNRL